MPHTKARAKKAHAHAHIVSRRTRDAFTSRDPVCTTWARARCRKEPFSFCAAIPEVVRFLERIPKRRHKRRSVIATTGVLVDGESFGTRLKAEEEEKSERKK